ncbi:MAG: hypothetical protein A2Z18_10570 [Armatimonadetes bacterium RBG_16_58_9]|nr:MAG: hypothetical protein A2Z18_10570 [Armatimonadetes bacterium RBG_16_58_9]
MAVRLPREYLDSLSGRRLRLYLFGELVTDPVDHPLIRPSVNSAAATYELSEGSAHGNVLAVKSHLTGRTINRFCHIHQSTDDLVAKVKMLRLIEHMTLGRGAVAYLAESMHGAGSPQAQRIMISRLTDLDHRKELARRLAGISSEKD